MTITVVAHAARSGIAALNVVTAALETDARTRDLDVPGFVRLGEHGRER